MLIEKIAKKIEDLTQQYDINYVEFQGLTTSEDDLVCDITGKTIKAGKYYGVNVTILFPVED